MLGSVRRTNILIVLRLKGDNMLFKLYLASVIACNISLVFHIYRIKKLVCTSCHLSELILSYCILAIPGLIPLVNLFVGLTWFMNAFIISDSEFIGTINEE